MSGLWIGGHPRLRPGLLEVPGPHRCVLVGLARRPVRRSGTVHRQPQPGQMGSPLRPPRLLPGPPRRLRGPAAQEQARRSLLALRSPRADYQVVTTLSLAGIVEAMRHVSLEVKGIALPE